MKTIKIGIIGAGRIGRVHAENIAKFVPEMEIKTIADPFMNEQTVELLPSPAAFRTPPRTQTTF